METYTVEYEGQILVIEVYSRERIEELKERVRAGNRILNEAWNAIIKIDLKSKQWADAVQQWHLQNVKLSAYCDQLKGFGFGDCLYIKDGKKYKTCLSDPLGCRVCPSSIAYWETEWMKL